MRAGRSSGFARKLTVVVLSRGGRFNRSDYFDSLNELGPDEIISIETAGTPSYDVEKLAARFDNLKFLLLHDAANPGKQVNLGIQESRGAFVLVLWSDMRLAGLPRRVIERAHADDLLCTVPMLKNDRGEIVPSIQAPAFFGKLLRVVPVMPGKPGVPTLFPFDYVGLYSRERFSLCGGFDDDIESPHWQKMDFGFRSYMWGEKMNCDVQLRIDYTAPLSTEDLTPDESYRLFYLKNLCVRYASDHGVLPPSRFFKFYLKTGGGLFQMYHMFRNIQGWVFTHRYRFKQDSASVTDLWEVADE